MSRFWLFCRETFCVESSKETIKEKNHEKKEIPKYSLSHLSNKNKGKKHDGNVSIDDDFLTNTNWKKTLSVILMPV